MVDKINKNTHSRVLEFIESSKIPFQHISHAAANTCELSARARKEPIEIGGKTLLFKSKKNFHLFVLSAAKEIDSNKVRKIVRSQRLRFASEKELYELAGVVKGALPPFGEPILPFELYLDESILRNDRIAFNAGLLTESIILNCTDYLEIIQANFGRVKYASFTKD